MALIQCPECGKDVSSAAELCIHCGYPLAKHFKREAELQPYDDDVRPLIEKIIPCEFKVPEPRTKVCIKCGKPFQEYLGAGFRKPTCKCGMPGVEVDYQELYGGNHNLPVQEYILEECVVPRNIGDENSIEYIEYVNQLRSDAKKYGYGRKPPSPEYFGIDPLTFNPRKSSLPRCPVCSSTNLSKLSATKSFLKIATFGIAGAGDVGKTWKCNKCGSKF